MKKKSLFKKIIFLLYLSSVHNEYFAKLNKIGPLSKNSLIFVKLIHIPCRFVLGIITLPYIIFLYLYDLRKSFKKVSEKEKFTFKKSEKTLPKKIHPVYFTCKRHFDQLFVSLKSLEKIKFNKIGNVYLYVDRMDGLTAKQIKIINEKINLNLKLRRTKYKNFRMFRLINVLNAYEEINKEISPYDYINKIDSDVLFISNHIFNTTIHSKKKLISHPVNRNTSFVFTQGGCYFFKSSIIPLIRRKRLFPVFKKFSQKIGKKPLIISSEDGPFYLLIKKITNKIKFIKFYYPENKIKENMQIDKKDLKKYSLIHFDRNRKNIMVSIAKKLKII